MTTIAAAKPFDPVKYKETTREQWQCAAQAWNDSGTKPMPAPSIAFTSSTLIDSHGNMHIWY